MPLLTELQPPLEMALARPAGTIPAASALPGGLVYEPKWDGFRLLVVVDDDDGGVVVVQAGKEPHPALPRHCCSGS